jgi:hypothetical protein
MTKHALTPLLLLLLTCTGCAEDEGGTQSDTSVDVITDAGSVQDTAGTDTVETDSAFEDAAEADTTTQDAVEPDADQPDIPAPTGKEHPTCSAPYPVVPVPADKTQWISQGFTRMTQVTAPGGGTIDIIAQDKVTDQMIVRAKNILEFFLTTVPDSVYGAAKADVANKMAQNKALLMLPNGSHEEGNEPNLPGQPLYQNEMTVEGSDWYMNNDFEHRDASFEEIFHLVHDAGIGTWLPGALPAYQDELLTEAKLAIEDGRWGIPVDPFVKDWLEELAQEDSLAQEYIASVIDSYYGYWGPWTEAPGGMWGIYIAKTRAEVASKDPAGKTLLEKFLSPWLTYEAWIAAEHEGMFSMTFDPSEPYTYKSQYLLNARLTGTNGASLRGNDQENVLRGNEANNTIDGMGGDDTLVCCQSRAAYTFEKDGGGFIVTGPDGIDTIKNIEFVHFADGLVPASELGN